jgi:hypothetical protein
VSCRWWASRLLGSAVLSCGRGGGKYWMCGGDGNPVCRMSLNGGGGGGIG